MRRRVDDGNVSVLRVHRQLVLHVFDLCEVALRECKPVGDTCHPLTPHLDDLAILRQRSDEVLIPRTLLLRVSTVDTKRHGTFSASSSS